MANLDSDFHTWQQQYTRLLESLFNEGLGSGIFTAFATDIQEAWQRLLVNWEDEPEKLQAILAGWQDALAAYQESITAVRSNPMLYINELQQLHGRLKQCLKQIVEEAPGINQADHRLLSFVSRQLVNALAVDNWPLTNEKVMKQAFESNGRSLIQGVQNFQEHVLSGKPGFEVKTSNTKDYVLGETIALTPGEVIFQNKLIQLIQYYPFSQEVKKEPLVIIPPWINKYYVLDLTPVNSFVQWAVKQGHTVYMISWANPDRELGELDLADYLSLGSRQAIDIAMQTSQSEKVNLLGFCIGGLLAGLTSAWLSEKNQDYINSLTLLNTMLDYSEPGDLSVFLSERILMALDTIAGTTKIVNGQHLRRMFMVLREDRMFWPYVVNNYLLGRDPEPNPMLFWNSDSSNLPYPMFRTYIQDMYVNNRLFMDEAYDIAGASIRVNELDLPVFSVASRKDHIVPWRSAYSSVSSLLDVEFVLADAGHIAGIINPPGSRRYGYWHGAIVNNSASAEAWQHSARQQPGSWWGHWQSWLAPQSESTVRARFPGENSHSILESAPGSYVRQRLDQ